MNRNVMLKILNPLLGLLMLNQILTGFLADELFRLSPNAFGILHEGGGIVLTVGILLHVVLNWAWIKATYLKKRAPSAKA